MQWFAVRVPPCSENKVRKYLEKRKHDGLAGRVGRVVVPERDGELLTPGYIFIEADWWPDGYVRPGFPKARTLGLISEEELGRLMSATVKPRIKKGDRVEVVEGPLSGQVGVVTWANAKRARVTFVFLGQEVTVEFEAEALKRLREEED